MERTNTELLHEFKQGNQGAAAFERFMDAVRRNEDTLKYIAGTNGNVYADTLEEARNAGIRGGGTIDGNKDETL